MKFLPILVSSLCIASACAESPRRGIPENVSEPIGCLGYRIGSYLQVEGVRADKGMGASRILMIDTIDGERLKSPIGIRIEDMSELPKGVRVVLKGYESGRWIGTPDEVEKVHPELQAQSGWQFFHFFVPTDIISPSTLKLE